MIKHNILLSFILFLSLVPGGQAREYTLEDLLDIALEHNTNIQVSTYNQQIREQELRKSRAAYLPKLSAAADIGYYEIESPGPGQDGSANTITLSASQFIYDFGKTARAVETAKHHLDASISDIASQTKNTVLSIKKAYYDILKAHQQILVAQESVKLDELQFSQAKAYFQAGVRTRIDVTNAKLQLSSSRLQLVQAKYDLDIAKTRLISLLGTNIDEPIQIKMDDRDIQTLAHTMDIPGKNLHDLIGKGLDNRPELKTLQAVVMAYKAGLGKVRSQYYPTLDVSASYTNKTSNDISSLESEQAGILFNLKWQLYTGNTTKSDTMIALANIHAAVRQLEQKKLEIRQNITDAYLNIQQSYESIRMNLLRIDLAAENLHLANERYQAGLNDLLEVNDAKLAYTQAKNSLVNACYLHLKNQADLDYALGR